MTAAELVEIPEDVEEFNAWAFDARWGDGLPLIPPTRERVDRMLTGTDWDAATVVTTLAPSHADATVEKIAINAVMTGCEPEHLPVLIAAVAAIGEPAFDLVGVQATTHPCGIMLMVNGPIAAYAGIHAGQGAFGPGFRANATIGRALRLILMNIADAWPGTTDLAVQGSPAKFGMCFAENERETPWEPFHVACGFDALDSTVTVMSAEGPHNINDHVSLTPDGVLTTTWHTIAGIGTNIAYLGGDCFICFGVEHARVLADAGMTRRDVQEYLFARVRIPFKIFRAGGMYWGDREDYLRFVDDDFPVPIVPDPSHFAVAVAGGYGRHSAWFPSWKERSLTRLVRTADGSAWRLP